MHEILNKLLLKQQKGNGKGWEMDFRVAADMIGQSTSGFGASKIPTPTISEGV
jgi:hypothetical protein